MPLVEFTCDRFGEDPLDGFGWRKTGKIGLAAQRRRVAGGDDHAVTRFDHRRRRPANEIRDALESSWYSWPIAECIRRPAHAAWPQFRCCRPRVACFCRP